jgi:hypothetical protein
MFILAKLVIVQPYSQDVLASNAIGSRSRVTTVEAMGKVDYMAAEPRTWDEMADVKIGVEQLRLWDLYFTSDVECSCLRL